MVSGTVQLGVGAKFNRFLSNIQLTESQLNDAKTKHEGVRRTLHNHYYSSGYFSSTSILVGSYGKNTATRPPSDIDILFIMPDSYFSQYYNSTGNGPSQLLQAVKNVLKKTYYSTDIRGDGQVVVVPFTSYGVEVLPVFSSGVNPGCYLTPNTHRGGSWNYTNPQAEKDHISTSNKLYNGNTVHLIKMTKVWKRVCSVPISSLAIELMAVPFISNWEYHGKTSTYYDYMIRDFFAYMQRRVNSYEPIPGISERYHLGYSWESKAKTAYSQAKSACEYEAGNYPYLAAAEWKKIFGTYWVG